MADKQYKAASAMKGSYKTDNAGDRTRIVPLDAVYMQGQTIIATEKKATAELYNKSGCVVIPTDKNQLVNDYIAAARQNVAGRIKSGEISRIIGAHTAVQDNLKS